MVSVVRRLAPQHLDGLAGGKLVGQGGVIGGHDRPGGALRIGGESQQVIALGLRQAGQQGVPLLG